MDQLCRVCMNSSVALVDIFEDSREPSLADILGECVACDIRSDDELPNKICLPCICDAQAAFKFKRRCEKSHQALSKMLQQNKVKCDRAIKLELAEHTNQSHVQLEPQNCLPIKLRNRNCSSSTDEQSENLRLQVDQSSNSHLNKQNKYQVNVQSELLTAEKWELAEENIDLGCVKIEGEDSIHSEKIAHNNQQEPSENTDDSFESIEHSNKERQELSVPNIACTNIDKIAPDIDSENVPKKNQYKCLHCSKCFTQSSHLNAHIRTHTGERPFKCSQCPKAFSQASNLRKHTSLHSGERPFKCPHCPKTFTRQTDLQYHISTHPGERIYKCPQCTRYFIESSELDEHIRYHTGERTYKCEECSREFTYAWQLQRHVRAHTREQPFKCTQCPKTCIDKGDLGRHMLSHTGERPHKCPHCPKAFTRAAYLKTHIHTHSNKYP